MPSSSCARPRRRELRVASYNVHRCVGSDGRRDVPRVARVIRDIDADIIGLQEIDCGYHYAQGTDQIEELQNATGMTAVTGPTLTRDACTYGNALLARLPVLSVRHTDLSIKRREPRAALDVDLEIDGGAVRVVVTHFGLSPRERRAQTIALLEALRGNTQPVTILCGDFNEWAPLWPTVRQLDGHFGRSPSPRTFPARRPVLALDRIWVRPAGALARMWVHQSPLSRAASDHLPICATLSL